MKHGKFTSAGPAAADYPALLAALTAIQSATPTARAAAAIHRRGDDLTALHELMTGARPAAAAGDAAALGNAFARRTPGCGGEDDQPLYRGVSRFVEAGPLEPSQSKGGVASAQFQGSR